MTEKTFKAGDLVSYAVRRPPPSKKVDILNAVVEACLETPEGPRFTIRVAPQKTYHSAHRASIGPIVEVRPEDCRDFNRGDHEGS